MTDQSVGPTRRLRPSRTSPTLLFLVAVICVFLSSCSASSTSSSTSSTTAGALAAIGITASTTSLTTTNTTDTFTASAADSSGNAITGLTFTWTSSNPNVATVNPSTLVVTATAPGFTEISASSGGITSNFVGLTVTAPLSGQYAFLVQGFDDATGDQLAMVGSFITDGNGTITSGLVDMNGPAGGNSTLNFSLPVELTFTGTYSTSTSAQNQGLLTFILSNGFTIHFRYSSGMFSGGIPTAGKMTQWDDTSGSNSDRAAGSFYLQNTAAFAVSSIAGPYALQFFGQQAAPGSWYVRTGAFNADGNGNLSGELDTNVVTSGSSSVQNVPSFTATFANDSGTPADTSTFGQFVFTLNSGASGSGFAYIVSPTQVLFMEFDPEGSSGLEAGEMLAQSTSSFSNASLNGVTVEYEQGLGSTASQPLAAIGLLTFGSGTTSISRDVEDSEALDGVTVSSWTAAASATLTPQTESLTFQAPVAANGRAVLMNGANEFAVVYLVAANEGFIMSATNSATMGFFQPQASGPFSAASIDGVYAGGAAPPTVAQPLNDTNGIPIVNDAEIVSGGNGAATITLDVNLHGNGPATSLISGQGGLTVTVTSNGRATDNQGDIYYVIGPSTFLMMIPDADGSPSGNPPGPPLTPVIDLFQQ